MTTPNEQSKASERHDLAQVYRIQADQLKHDLESPDSVISCPHYQEHPAFFRIISHGRKMVPLVIADLEAVRGDYALALLCGLLPEIDLGRLDGVSYWTVDSKVQR